MLNLPITKEQLLFLIDQLSETEKQEILQHLIQQQPLDPDDTPDEIVPLDPDDTPDEIVIANIRQGFKEALSGQLIPLEQM